MSLDRVVNVRILNNAPLRDLREAAKNTINKKWDEAEIVEPTAELNLWHNYLKSEHSPIRAITVRITMQDISYYTSVHFARHVHALHFVATSRPDRTGAPRSVDRVVTHIMDCNLQSLIDMMRKRLCIGQCAPDTYAWAVAIKQALMRLNIPIAHYLVPNCVYRARCPEHKSCCLLRWIEPEERYQSYQQIFDQVVLDGHYVAVLVTKSKGE